MTVDLPLLGWAAGAALIYNFLLPAKTRSWFVLGVSIIALFWLQPALPIRWSGFLLPLLLIVLIVVSWWATRGPDHQKFDSISWRAFIFIVILIGGLALIRFAPVDWRPTLNRPPPIPWITLLLAGFTGLAAFFRQTTAGHRARIITAGVIILLFVVFKWPWLTEMLSSGWRTAADQNPILANPADLSWLGYSYIAFRLLHTIRDRHTGQLPVMSLHSYLGYVLFFPALLAGPIDRAERFQPEWERLQELVPANWERWSKALGRIAIGLGKKFILADSLAFGLSFNPTLATEVERPGWLWLLLYGYAMRLYFDFSGYTDMAIGVGLLFGIELPENFNRPYWQTSLTDFWKSWHITLSDWVRFYVFTPLSRALLRRKPRPSTWLIILISQLTTMLIIGLWHGITLNFFIWGAWHGLGLFVHKMWSDRTRRWYRRLGERPRMALSWTWVGRLLTFHYVVLGWVWFVVPEYNLAIEVLTTLLGGGS